MILQARPPSSSSPWFRADGYMQVLQAVDRGQLPDSAQIQTLCVCMLMGL